MHGPGFRVVARPASHPSGFIAAKPTVHTAAPRVELPSSVGVAWSAALTPGSKRALGCMISQTTGRSSDGHSAGVSCSQGSAMSGTLIQPLLTRVRGGSDYRADRQEGRRSMARDDTDTTECPFCKEVVRANAVLCKHCGSRLSPPTLQHDGVCPFCKEEIHPEATRCKHCRSNLAVDERARTDKAGGCGCGGGCSGGPEAGRRLPRWSALGTRSYPDPDCFHDCFWRCFDGTGDAQWCWIACDYLCPPATLPR